MPSLSSLFSCSSSGFFFLPYPLPFFFFLLFLPHSFFSCVKTGKIATGERNESLTARLVIVINDCDCSSVEAQSGENPFCDLNSPWRSKSKLIGLDNLFPVHPHPFHLSRHRYDYAAQTFVITNPSRARMQLHALRTSTTTGRMARRKLSCENIFRANENFTDWHRGTRITAATAS